MGENAVEPHADSVPAGEAEAFRLQASVSGAVTTAHVYIDAHNAARRVIVGLYSDVSGQPGSLLSAGSISTVQPAAWNTVLLSPSVLVSGKNYWLAVLGQHGTLRYRDRSNGPCVSETSAQSDLKTMAASWSAGESYSTCPISAYVSGVSSPLESPPPPTASFTGTPTSPVVGQSVEFDGTSSTCPDGPCAYSWSDDGSTTQPISIQWPLGSGQTLSFTFHEVGTKYVRLTVRDALGRTATVEHNVAVAAESPPPPPPPTAPSNTVPPTVSGTAQIGQNVAVSNGSWTGSTPMSYRYQWQRDGTSTIAGATGSSYRPVATDVGHTLDAVVITSNSAGNASATSTSTKAIAGEPAKEPTEEPAKEPAEEPSKEPSGQTNCINAPSACGYPDATNTGVPAGAKLTAQETEMSVSTPGTTIKDLALNGTINVEANNTTIEESDITVDGTQSGCSGSCGGRGIWIKPGVTGTLIQDVACHGGARSGSNVTQYCVMSNNATTTIKRLHAYNCTECLAGPMNLSDSFIDESGATIPQEHYEDIYYGGGAGALIVNHNTMLNPQGQTAVVFASVDFGNQTKLTITNNLMAGGGYVIYGGGSGSEGSITGPVTITGNRFSREYYPEGGSYGVAAYMNEARTAWSGNVWDETLQSVER